VTDLNRIQLEITMFDQNGHALLPGPDYNIGDKVDIDTLDDPEEIRIKGEVFAYIQPIGEIPPLSLGNSLPAYSGRDVDLLGSGRDHRHPAVRYLGGG